MQKSSPQHCALHSNYFFSLSWQETPFSQIIPPIISFTCFLNSIKYLLSILMYSVCAWLLSLYFTQHYGYIIYLSVSSVTQLCHGLQHTRPPCPSPTPRACSNSCPSSRWCHPTISSSVIPFSSYLQSFPALGSFLMGWLFISGDQSIGASAATSVLPVNIQDLFPLWFTGFFSLQSKGLSRVFSNTTVQKHQFFST